MGSGVYKIKPSRMNSSFKSPHNPRGFFLLALVLTGSLLVFLRLSTSSSITTSGSHLVMPNFDFDSSHSAAHLAEAQTDEEDELLLALTKGDEGEDDDVNESDDELAEDLLEPDMEDPVHLRVMHRPSAHTSLVPTLPPPFLPYTCSSCRTPDVPTPHPLPVCAKYHGSRAQNRTYDPALLDRSVVFSGSGQEVRRVLKRQLKSLLYAAKRRKEGTVNDIMLYEDEESFRILVLGGSVSNCRGVSSQTCWHSRVEDWFHRILPLEGDPKPRQALPPYPPISAGPARIAQDDVLEVSSKRKRSWKANLRPSLNLQKRTTDTAQKKGRKKESGKKKKGKSKVLEPTTAGGRKRPVTRVINAAKSATGSAFYAHCFEAEMETRGKSQTWGKGPDMVVLEFGVNDVWPTTEAATKDFEKLLFYLRSLPSKPAVVILEAASLLLAQSSSTMTNAEYLHLPAAHFHDVPVLSTKHALFGPTPAILPSSGLIMEDLFLPDLHHFNERGHELLADVLTSYLEKEACKAQSEILEVAAERVATSRMPVQLMVEPELDLTARRAEVLLALPSRSLFTPYSSTPRLGQFLVPKPTCLQVGNSRSRVLPTHNVGWTKYSWARDKQYLVADKPGSTVTFQVNVGSGGEVLVDWLRSRFYDLGNIVIYLDGQRQKGKTLAGYWDLGWSIGVPTIVFSGVPDGPHKVTIELLAASQSDHPGQKTNFRLIGIITS